MLSLDEAATVDVAALGAAVRARLEERLRRAFPGLLERWPVQACGPLPAARSQGYNAGAELRRLCAAIVRVHGRPPMASWLRLLLCLSIGHAEPQLSALRLTHDIQRMYRREWCRILDSVESLPDVFFDPAEDKFQKDLALVRLRLIPAGAGLVDPTSRVAPRFLLARGPWEAGRGAWFLVLAGGLGPYYRFHLDSRFLQEFTPRGWEQTYLRIADLLELNPEMLGVVRSSWFFDPALETISPHLVYLRRTIVDHGGAVFYSGRSANVTRDALAKSATRRRLHDQGKYNPAEYLAIWPRRGLLRWARAMRAGGAVTGGPGPAEPPAGDEFYRDVFDGKPVIEEGGATPTAPEGRQAAHEAIR